MFNVSTFWCNRALTRSEKSEHTVSEQNQGGWYLTECKILEGKGQERIFPSVLEMKDEVQIQEGQIFITILTLCRGLAGKLSVVLLLLNTKCIKVYPCSSVYFMEYVMSLIKRIYSLTVHDQASLWFIIIIIIIIYHGEQVHILQQ